MGKRSVAAVVVAIALIAATGAAAGARPDRTHPDAADHNTLITVRNALRDDALRTLQTVGRCERGVRDPYGAQRDAFNHCILTRLNEDLYTSRFEPPMLIGVLRDLAPGRCAGLASGLLDGISQLGGESETWIGDAENPDPSAAALEQADAHDMRSIIRGILVLTAARGWRTACRPRAYQPSEHHSLRHVAEVFTA